MTANSTDPMIGRLIDGRYQVRSRIARGGMATVYLASDLRLERRVAIKIMHGHLADDREFRDRFVQEARSAARLAHPNVVNVYDQGQDSEMAYLVMEYLPGITLRDLLDEHPILTTEQTLDIMEAVLGGLAAAHKAGIVHRDLKPENVLLADDGRIKIGDFGLARASSANTATGAALLGTVAYLSPELVTRGVADTRSDIYAIGIMLYEMLVGEQPYTGDQPMQIAYQHANDVVPAPSGKNAQVPLELDELVLWATARNPQDRPADARTLLDSLFEAHSVLLSAGAATSAQATVVMPRATGFPGGTVETQVISGRTQEPPNPGLPDSAVELASQTRRRKSRGRWLVAIVISVVAAAAIAGWYFGAGPGSKVAIPNSVAGMSVEEATVTLESLGLSVALTTGTIDDPIIAIGLIADTDPPLGSLVTKGSEIQLLVSTGPRPIALPSFVGMTEDQAREAINAAPFTLAEPIIRQFDSTVALGIVLDALGPDGVTLTGQETLGELQPVVLVVSAGPVPSVIGLSVDDASAVLSNAGLTVGAINAAEFSDTVPEGAVIRAQGVGSDPARIRVGDTVDLITSRGVELILIPDVVGQLWSDAKQQLLDAGFELDYNIFADAAPNLFTVSVLTPDGGTTAPRGSTVKVNFTS